MIGRQLGSYIIREEVGKGGMATVYRAYQPAVDRDVAIKVITRSLAADQQAAQRFQREARLIARLEHPHILPVHDFDGGHEPPYIVMRYLDGGTLKDVLAQGMLPPTEVGYLVRQVAAALDYAHRQGIVHRDVKPSNILIDREGNAFVTDFGIARIVAGESGQQITATGAIVGTPDYMAPEQVMGAADVGHRADIYALGVILFQMLTGRLPYEADSAMSVLLMHLHDPLPSAVTLNAALPPAVDEVVRRALAKEPADRYGSAADLADAVTETLGGAASRPTRLPQAAEDSMVLRRLAPAGDGTGSRTPSEQNKSVTALYANAAEYAEIVDEFRGSQAARQAIGELWRTAGEVVLAQGGLVASQSEENLLALWGAEAAREDDAERAVQAALDIQAALKELGEEFLAAENGEAEPLPLQIGINTGLALLAPAETGDYSASGAAISLTYRLMQQADGAILITHPTFAQVRGVFEVEPDSPLRLRRGRQEVAVYRVNAAKPRAFRLNTRGVEGVETKMIGREAELRTLQNAFLDAVEDEETQAVTVAGEPGLGKSRLLYQFANWAELRPERYWILRGRATPEMTNRPYALLRDVLSFRYEIQDSDDPATVRQKLEEGIAEQIGQEEEMAHLLGYLAGFDMAESPFVKGMLGDAQQLANRGIQLFNRWLVRLAEENAVVFELEDIHYADIASLDLLTNFLSDHDEAPLLLICLARPALFERRPEWGSGQAFHTRLDLRPLDKRASRGLAREILQKVERVPKSLRDLLVERAEGNPYYMEELVKTLIDNRVIIKESEAVWRVEEERLGHLEVPTTIFGLLQSRLDSLLQPERLTLQRAAVVGRVFYDDALAALNAADDSDVDDLAGVLQRLVDGEFIFRRETTAFAGQREYIFGSNMLRDMLLDTLLSSQMRTYNAAAAAWLAAASAGREDEYSALIADLYERAGEDEAAARYLRRAAEKALQVGDFGQSRALLERALVLIDEAGPLQLSLQLRLGETFYHLGNLPASRKALLAAQAMAREQEADLASLRATFWLGQVAVLEGDFGKTQQLLEENLPLARAQGDETILAQFLYGLGNAHYHRGQYAAAGTLLQESLALARQLGDANAELLALNRLGTVAFSQERYEEARQYLEETLTKSRQLGNRDRLSGALTNLSLIAYVEGSYDSYVAYNEQAVAVARETGNDSSLALMLMNLAEGYYFTDRPDLARETLYEGLALSLRRGLTPLVLSGLRSAGWLAIQAGEREKGLAYMGLGMHHPGAGAFAELDAADSLQKVGLERDDPEVVAGLAAGAELDVEETAAAVLAELEAEIESVE